MSDVRKREQGFSLAQHSFAAVTDSPLVELDFTNVAETENCYSLSAVNLIHKYLPASRKVVVFDTTIRKASPEVYCRPVRKVHINQTPLGVLRQVRKHSTEHEAAHPEAGTLLIADSSTELHLWERFDQVG